MVFYNEYFPLKGNGWIGNSRGGGWWWESRVLFLSSKVIPQMEYCAKSTRVFIGNSNIQQKIVFISSHADSLFSVNFKGSSGTI